LAKAHFIMWVERQGQTLRGRLKLASRDPLDPFKLAGLMQAQIYSPYDVLNLPSADLDQLLTVDSQSWSAGSVRLPDGEVAIILNPVHADTRKRASLMEELSHIYLHHKPSQIIINDHLAIRTFNKTQETQAYWVGAAALVPKAALEHARSRLIAKETLANDLGVSLSLVGFRENVTGVKLH
jgi:IrrE N-terminal-like domain